jgi:hypothetical protein
MDVSGEEVHVFGLVIGFLALGIQGGNLYQSIQAAKRKGMQQNSVDDAEQCGIGANPKSQHRNYNQRKPEIFPKAPHGSSLPSGTEKPKNQRGLRNQVTKEQSFARLVKTWLPLTIDLSNHESGNARH